MFVSGCDCIVALLLAVLAVLALMCHSLREVLRLLTDPNNSSGTTIPSVHVPELAEVGSSLNAMRTHLYQIGRALDARSSSCEDHKKKGE